MSENILIGLNPKQKEAITEPEQVVRVIAGAGTGKTRVLVRKIEWFLTEKALLPEQILALTFTNKAAKEMRERLEVAVGKRLEKLWVGTFHSICHRILRQYAPTLGWSSQFSILDSDEQLRLIKRLMKAQKIDENNCSPQKMLSLINQYKENGLRAESIPISQQSEDSYIQPFYALYEKTCYQQATMDFAELLLLTLELLQKNQMVREKLQRRFQAVLVDEFQDTNHLQYQIIKALMGAKSSLFVVGDDDQSIYGWRGAKIEHILRLEQDFPTLKTIHLEQNYRSTEIILQAANAVIANNNNRLGKNLWTSQKGGKKIALFSAPNEAEEAQFIFRQIKKWQLEGGKLSDCAVLYRSNAQSRMIETIFLQQQMPYAIFGGLRFFARAEIKDSLAYLRACQFPEDNHTLIRIINHPTRGIGEKTLSKLQQLAEKTGLSFWHLISHQHYREKYFSGRAQKALADFVTLMMEMRRKISEKDKLSAVISVVVYDSGLFQKYQQEATEQALERCQNLRELIQSATDYSIGKNLPEQIENFLAYAVLDTGEETGQNGKDCVQLMTLHSAKGLEFERVFIVGWEEGIFPANLAEELEEERRLAYVGITRAKSQLTLSWAENRRVYEEVKKTTPSRFLSEIPENLLSLCSSLPLAQVRKERKTVTLAGFTVGEKVSHTHFGEGKITRLEGEGKHARAAVAFSSGEKVLVIAYANLEKIPT